MLEKYICIYSITGYVFIFLRILSFFRLCIFPFIAIYTPGIAINGKILLIYILKKVIRLKLY